MTTYQLSFCLPASNPHFTIEEWHTHNRYRHRCSEIQQESADQILGKSKRVCELTDETTKTNKDETNHRLEEKLKDIEFRKNELLRIRKEIALEIDALETFKNRIVSTLSSIRKNVLDICQKCLSLREQRLGVDLVHDHVERELLAEIKAVKNGENSLVRILEDTNEQLRKLKSRLYYMDRDIEDKKFNLNIDRHNLKLTESNVDLKTYDTSCLSLPSSTLNEWEMQTDRNIKAANKEMEKARPMRSYINTMIKNVITDLTLRRDATNEAFRLRIEETKKAKSKLESQHAEIIQQVADMQSNIKDIEKSLSEKEGYMALSHSRLLNRCQRPGLELTRDLVEVSLLKEVHDLRDTVANLQKTLCEAQASLRFLLRAQILIEDDINIKTNTLKIDEVDCMTLRQSIDYHAH